MPEHRHRLHRRRKGRDAHSALPLSRIRQSSRAIGGGGAFISRLFVGCFSAIVVVFVILGIVGYAAYASLTAELLPRLETIRGRTTFETSRLLDRNGVVLYEFFGTGRRTKVGLANVSKDLINGTISIEDKTFYSNPGVDYFGIARAAFYSATAGEVVGGGSTISQQVIKQVVLTEQERSNDIESRIRRKVVEVVLAQEISNQYTKDEILELYVNEIYYGNLAYGIEAASNTYFKTTAAQLTLPQAALLAGMPQLPTAYDPYLYTVNNVIPGISLNAGWRNPNYDLGDETSPTKWRQIAVLRQMVDNGYITEAAAVAAAAEDLRFAGVEVPINAPHFVFYVRRMLEEQYGPQFATLGYSIYTTIDLELQQTAQKIATERIAELVDRNIHNASVVVMQPNTGQILAMVGSVDYNRTEQTNTAGFEGNVLDGQVNVATNLRQPGSALKPFNYMAAMERGMTPATVLWDVEKTFPSIGTERYTPKNYNGKWNGPLRMRQALANSLNMPAIDALRYGGISNLLGLLDRVGIKSLQRGEGFYGLALTLGGGEVTPLELTAAYNTIASNGIYYEPKAILKVVDPKGAIIDQLQTPIGIPAVKPDIVGIIVDMMSDDTARAAIWGTNSKLKLSRPAGVKTGTSNDWRDAWALGYTPYVTVGVWTGNNNNEPTDKVESLTGGGIIWRNIMEYIFASERLNTLLAEPFNGELPVDFIRPKGITEQPICPLPGPFNNRSTELFTRTMAAGPIAPLPSDEPSLPDPTGLPDQGGPDPCAGLLQPVTVVKINLDLPLSGVITDTAVISTSLCTPTEGLSVPPDRVVNAVAWIVPPPEPDINVNLNWEVAANAAERTPPILPFDAAMIPVCTTELLGQFGPPVEGAVRMPELRKMDAQTALSTLNQLGITNVFVDEQSRDRIPDVFDQYGPYEVIGTIPSVGEWILPGASVVIGARGP
jgi:peptidoglycan glycosyltransferase